MFKSETYRFLRLAAPTDEEVAAGAPGRRDGARERLPLPAHFRMTNTCPWGPYAQGFIFDDGDTSANTPDDLKEIKENAPSEYAHIQKYVSGEDINARSYHTSTQCIVQVSHIDSKAHLKRLPHLHRIIQ